MCWVVGLDKGFCCWVWTVLYFRALIVRFVCYLALSLLWSGTGVVCCAGLCVFILYLFIGSCLLICMCLLTTFAWTCLFGLGLVWVCFGYVGCLVCWLVLLLFGWYCGVLLIGYFVLVLVEWFVVCLFCLSLCLLIWCIYCFTL